MVDFCIYDNFLDEENFSNGEYLTEEEHRTHKHSTHVEDIPLIDGKSGVKKAIDVLVAVKDRFGVSDGNAHQIISTKIDGAPAIVSGWIGNKFFVATKSLFNKEPKVNFTDDDIDTNHGDKKELADKLKIALKYFKDIIPKGTIVQGDFLYGTKDKKSEAIDGVAHWTWHPNTIKYAIVKDTPLGKKIGLSKVGIVFHTRYKINGEDIHSISLAGFDVMSSEFKSNKDVWVTDAFQKNLGSIPHFNADENKVFDALAKDANSLAGGVPWDWVKLYGYDYVMPFLNDYIKRCVGYPTTNQMYSDLISWLETKKNNEILSKKTDKFKQKVVEKYTPILNAPKGIVNLFRIYKDITEMKMMIIRKINLIKSTKTFLLKRDGTLVSVEDEGYCLTQTSANGCKLVDRLQFSAANFSDMFKHGFEK